MKTSRRIARMSRNRRKVPGLNLTSMMDVFTILLFFLMFHSGTSELLQEPKSVSLPDSVVESKPRETVVIVVGRDEVTVQGEVVAPCRGHPGDARPGDHADQRTAGGTQAKRHRDQHAGGSPKARR